MATSSQDSIFGLGTTAIFVPAGATNALLFEAIAGQNNVQLKYGSGGSLYIIGVAAGVTLSAQNLSDNATAHYLMGTSEVLSIDGPVRCYLASLSATTVLYQIRGKSQGT